MLPYLIAGVIGYGISKLFDDKKAPKYNDGGLVAPNGKPSNLTPEQYKLVRTKAFKDWFGDWEKDPANASKVVDENGEPKVVARMDYKKKYNYGEEYPIFFCEKEDVKFFTEFGKNETYVFLNLKKPIIIQFGQSWDNMAYDELLKVFSKKDLTNMINNEWNDNYKSWDEYLISMDDSEPFLFSTDIISNYVKNKGINDGLIIYDIDETSNHEVNTNDYIVFNSSQIKLADGTNTTFDSNNPDIRFNGGGEVNKKLILDFVNQVEAYQSNHYGTFNRDNLVESYHKLPDSIKEKIKPITTKNLFRGADGTSYKSAISFAKNQDYAKMFGTYAFPFKVVKENKGLIDTKRLSALLSKMRIPNEIGDDEGEVIVIEPIFSKDIIENIEKFRFDNGGLIAPNGKPSNLTPEQYKLVRTPEFKAWFGDWENNPENASKVVDENGEPLVVYHYSKNDFNIFNAKGKIEVLGGIDEKGDIIPKIIENYGMYFTDNIESRNFYLNKKGKYEYECFINIKNPYFTDDYRWSMLINEERFTFLQENKFDGVISTKTIKEYVAFEPEQIKLADGTNTTFDGSNPDIRFDKGGNVNSGAFKKWFGNSKVVDKKGNPLIVYHGSPDLRGLKEKYIFESRFLDNQSFFFTDNYSMAKSYADPKNAFDYQNAEEGVIGLYLSLQNPLIVNAFNQIWRKFETTIDGNEIIGTRNLIKFAQNKGYDGVIVENVRDYYNNNDKKTKGGNVYVAFYPNQIKLANGSNTTFDGNNPDIRFDGGGVTDSDKIEFIDDRVLINGNDFGLLEFTIKENELEIRRLYLNKENQRIGIGRKIIGELFNQNPDVNKIIVYPLGSSIPFWLRFTEKVREDDYFEITKDSLKKGNENYPLKNNNRNDKFNDGGEARPFYDDGNKYVVFKEYRNYEFYKIAVDDVNDANYISLWKTNKDTGIDKKVGSLKLNKTPYNFLSVSEISIDSNSKGLGLGLEMYKVALKYSSNKIKGIKSYLPNRSNKRQIPKIYRKLNSVKEGDWDIIYKKNNPDIRYDGGGKVLSYNDVLKKQQTGDYYFDFLFSNENSKFIEETIDIRELRELNGFSDDEDEIEHTISYFNDLDMDEDYEIGRKLMNKIVDGVELSPIVVDEEYKLLDGRHRLSAYSELYYYYSYDFPFDGKLKIYKRISN